LDGSLHVHRNRLPTNQKKVWVGSRSGELVAVGIGELGSRLQVVLVSG